MKQDWWKLLVVVVLVVAVGFALATKNRSSDSAAIVATETAETPAPEELLVNSDIQDEPATQTADEELAKQDAPAKVVKPETASPVADSKKPAEPKPTAQAKPVATKLPKMVELGADKCMQCKMMKPIVAELQKEYKDKIEVVFIDVWKDETAVKKYGIETIPTQVFLDEDGKEFFRHTGFFPKQDILKVFKDQGYDLD